MSDRHGRLPSRPEPPDPVAEAGALRAEPGQAPARTARLIARLKWHHKEGRAVQAALAALRRRAPPDD